MTNEKNVVISYQGNQINIWSDEKKDYFDLTEIANAVKGKGTKTIRTWLKSTKTLEFLRVWERKNNPDFNDTNWDLILQKARDTGTSFSVKYFIEETNAKGIFATADSTRAHKDIAIKFAAYVSPELELFLIEEVQRLKEFEKSVDSINYLTKEQVLYLVQLKEVFRYVLHQYVIEDAHKEVYASKSSALNPFANFHKWRNNILDLRPEVIDERIKKYCEDNKIALTDKMLRKSKHEKLLILDSYGAVRNAVWDFLLVKGMDEVQALSMANLAGDVIRTERGEVLRQNETDLFHTQQNLGNFSDFVKKVPYMAEIKTARQLLALRAEEQKKLQNLSSFNQNLKTALEYDPEKGPGKKGPGKRGRKKSTDPSQAKLL